MRISDGRLASRLSGCVEQSLRGTQPDLRGSQPDCSSVLPHTATEQSVRSVQLRLRGIVRLTLALLLLAAISSGSIA
jgi:hypothetical protein